MYQFSGKTNNFEFFGPNLLKNGFRVEKSENWFWNKNQHRQDAMNANFQKKRTTLTFSTKICPKMGFVVGICPDSKSASLRHYVYQFSDKTDNFEFLGLNFSKNGFWGQNFKNLSLDLESASLRYCVYQSSDKTDNFEFLGPNLSQNGFWGRNFKSLSLGLESTPPIYHLRQFLVKMDNF